MDIFELSYIGFPRGLMRYIESFMVWCKDCKDTGFIKKIEWSEVDGRDMDWENIIRCYCQLN